MLGAALVCSLTLAGPARAQRQSEWNDPRALELIARARQQRAALVSDTGLVDYQADARGSVYFYLDRRDTGERTLVKTDQVALDVLWKAPGFNKQRIIGLRDAKRLPTNIQYHQDHLSVVQDNFGDRIRLGNGDEVRDVVHPAAPGAARLYDFRLADSSSIRLPGAAEPAWVYEVQVRPKATAGPSFVGSVFIDRRQGAIVRMAFTFTRDAYIDRQIDYINISLESGLWKGRFWLPDRQQVEIRRQLPELGFPAGGMIRGTMRISNYRFNRGLPLTAFSGPRVESVPAARRRAFAFERGMYDDLREQGLGPGVELGEVRRLAANLASERLLSGLPLLRADVPAVSSVLRYNRAEALALGFGGTWRLSERAEVRAAGGWAFGPRHPLASLRVRRAAPGLGASVEAYLNRPRDVGAVPAASGILNTLSAAFAARDYTDPFYAGGAALRLDRQAGAGWAPAFELRAERQTSAAREAGGALIGGAGEFRPVRPINDGEMLRAEAALARRAPADVARAWSAALRLGAGLLHADSSGAALRFLRPEAELRWTRRGSRRNAAAAVTLTAGAALGRLPRQEMFLLGGRGTVPGFGFRAFGGDRFALLRATAAADVAAPWLRARLLGAAGWTGMGDAGRPALAEWGGARATPRPRASLGTGAGLFYDILRADLYRGLGAGSRWELVVEANTAFWDFL